METGNCADKAFFSVEQLPAPFGYDSTRRLLRARLHCFESFEMAFRSARVQNSTVTTGHSTRNRIGPICLIRTDYACAYLKKFIVVCSTIAAPLPSRSKTYNSPKSIRLFLVSQTNRAHHYYVGSLYCDCNRKCIMYYEHVCAARRFQKILPVMCRKWTFDLTQLSTTST